MSFVFAAFAVATSLVVADPPLMRWPDLTSRPLPSPTQTVLLGDGASDVVDVWLPEGDGPHPVLIMVHGGCWQKQIADRTLMNYAAEAFRHEGIAVWNIEYRGVDEAGGGYPGTFLDVANAIDSLDQYIDQYNLDSERIAGFGHSAGGHLITWAAARGQLPSTSQLHRDDPVMISYVVNSGGLADLETSRPVTLPSCLDAIHDKLVGQVSDDRPDVYADTSPAKLTPSSVEVMSVNAADDRIAPPILGLGFTRTLADKGVRASYVSVQGGHVELISPGTEAFLVQVNLLKDFLLPQ